MKQSFGKTLLSCFLTVTLMASVIAGAISVSVLHANADDPASYGVGYFADLAAEARTSCPAIRLVYFDALCAYVSENFDTSLVVVMHDLNTTNWYFAVYTFDPNNDADRWAFTDRNYSVFKARSSNNSFYFYCQYCVGWTSNHSFNVINPPKYIDSANGSSVSYGTQGYFVPSPTNTEVTGRVCYANQTILAWSGSGSIFNEYWTPNLLNGSAPPQYEEFELVKFSLGERSYLTVSNQYLLVSDLWAEHLYWDLYNDQGDLLDLTFYDLIEFPDGKSYINYEFTDEGDNSVYAYDITNLDWAVIESSNMYDIPPSSTLIDVYAVATNTPFNLQSSVNDTNSFAEAWDSFYTFYNTYNTTNVVPESLSDYIFGTNGSKLFPVSVQFPGKIWYDGYDVNTADLSVHTFSWGSTSLDNLAMNFDLMDTVILGAGGPAYGYRYFYSDTLDPMYNFIDVFQFTNILESSDVVVIVPDDYHLLNEGYFATGAPVAYTGSSGQGISFTTDPLTTNVFTGFAIITERAFQKQMLWNFNDGISKLYDLEVQYIDSEDRWKNSFLLWTASLFEQWNSLDGHLNSIDTLLNSWKLDEWFNDIKNKLDQLISNTGEFEWNFWYMSLFSWVNQFKPDNSDFTAGLEQYDNNWEDFPELPAPSTVPLLPTIGG